MPPPTASRPDPADAVGPAPARGVGPADPPALAVPRVLDLSGVCDRQAFMDRVAADLRLPGWFGRTWDALADCLTDLSWWPAGTYGRRLQIRGWRQFAVALPREWLIVRDILRDAEVFWRRRGTVLTVSLADPPGGLVVDRVATPAPR